MRTFSVLAAIVLLSISTSVGCGPSGPTEDMGTVVDEIPAVKGADEPYVIPELGPPSDGIEKAKESQPSSAKPESAHQPDSEPAADTNLEVDVKS